MLAIGQSSLAPIIAAIIGILALFVPPFIERYASGHICKTELDPQRILHKVTEHLSAS
jgi:hypothetical protein